MKPSYYAIIPAEVRYSTLKPNTKLLYGEITALSSKEGYCFASNRYFAELYKVTKNTISSWISDLNNYGFVTVTLIKKGNQVVERRIGITKIKDTPITKKEEDSITTNNNTIINLIKRKEIFKLEIFSLKADDATKIKFFEYWTELSKNKKKMKFELQETWETKLRFLRWKPEFKKGKKKADFIDKMETFKSAKEKMKKINQQ